MCDDPIMHRYHFDVRNEYAALADKKGRHCDSVLEAMVLAKSALTMLAEDESLDPLPWIEIADEQGCIVATVRVDEIQN